MRLRAVAVITLLALVACGTRPPHPRFARAGVATSVVASTTTEPPTTTTTFPPTTVA
nr:hypothetical protein [Actinomycetota bacterium]